MRSVRIIFYEIEGHDVTTTETHPTAPVSTMFLYVLGGVYLVYLMALGNVLYTWMSTRAETIIEHPVNTNPDVVVKHWTVASMRDPTEADQQIGNAPAFPQGSIDTGS